MEASACFAVAEYREIQLAALFIAGDYSIAGNKWELRRSKPEIKKYKEAQEMVFQIVMDVLASQK